jgi:hypothetical protein
MRIQLDLAALGKTKWHEYAIRFVFGGVMTAVAGVIAKVYGPVIGGLFLACPAIFPATATLIEKHEQQRKECAGLRGKVRGREAASVDAAGSAIGSIGLVAFAAVTWKLVLHSSVWLVFLGATLTWLSVSVLFWHLRKRDQMFLKMRLR